MHKQSIHFGSALAVLIFSVSLLSMPAMAQQLQPQQAVNGFVQQVFAAPFGNAQAGSNVSGWSDANFAVTDPQQAIGTAIANGSGTGSQSITPTSVTSKGFSTVASQASGTGATVNVALAGEGDQSDWANIGTGTQNGAGGYNVTTASYNGGAQQSQGRGGATATGSTVATTIQNQDISTSTITTTGQSAATLNVPGNVQASGNATVAAVSMMGNPNIPGGAFAGGNIQGGAYYTGVGATQAQGGLTITGSTSGQVNPTNVSASATIISIAMASGK